MDNNSSLSPFLVFSAEIRHTRRKRLRPPKLYVLIIVPPGLSAARSRLSNLHQNISNHAAIGSGPKNMHTSKGVENLLSRMGILVCVVDELSKVRSFFQELKLRLTRKSIRYTHMSMQLGKQYLLCIGSVVLLV